jgi:ribosomal protein L22
MSTTNSNDDVVSHAINAAEANAEDSQSKQQVEELSSMLQSATTNASENEETSSQE